MLNERELTAIRSGSLFVTDAHGAPVRDLRYLFFVWYREADQPEAEYRLLLKTVRARKEATLVLLQDLRLTIGPDYESGVGQLDMVTGRMVVFKPDHL